MAKTCSTCIHLNAKSTICHTCIVKTTKMFDRTKWRQGPDMEEASEHDARLIASTVRHVLDYIREYAAQGGPGRDYDLPGVEQAVEVVEDRMGVWE